MEGAVPTTPSKRSHLVSFQLQHNFSLNDRARLTFTSLDCQVRVQLLIHFVAEIGE
jgi:hypothetical protein